jgi:hypothetical protein
LKLKVLSMKVDKDYVRALIKKTGHPDKHGERVL